MGQRLGNWDSFEAIVTETLKRIGDITTEMTGFTAADAANVQYSIADTTGVATVSPISGSFNVWVAGNKFTIKDAQTVTIDKSEGLHMIYFDGDGVLQSTTDPVSVLPLVAFVFESYWNASNDTSIDEGEERHGLVMDGGTHYYLHLTRGAQYISGFNVTSIVTDGTGNNATDCQIEISHGVIADEDILDDSSNSSQTVSLPAQIPVWYIDGPSGTWRKSTADDFPVLNTGTGRVAYNELSGGNYQQTEVTNTKFVLYHIFGTNHIGEPIISVQGQNEYTTLAGARLAAIDEIEQLNTIGLPTLEWVPLYTLIIQTSDSYSNAVKARIRTTDEGDDFVDWRFQRLAAGGGGTGDVAGPTSSTDNAIVRYDGTTGKLIQDSGVTIDDTNIIGSIAGLGFTGADVDATSATENGTITFVGTVAGPTLRDMIKLDPVNGVGLFHAGSNVVQTKAGGVTVNNAAESSNITLSTDLTIANNVDDGKVILSPSTGGGETVRLDMTSANQYLGNQAQGYLHFDQTNLRAYLRSNHVTGPSIYLDANSGADDAYVYSSGTNVAIHLDDNNVNLYAGGAKVASTKDGGFDLWSGASQAAIYTDGTLYIDHYVHAGNIHVRGEDGAGITKTVFLSDLTTGVSSLYYNGATALSTIGDDSTYAGININYNGSPGCSIYTKTNTDDTYIDALDPDGQVYIRSRNVADSATNTLFYGDPDASSGLYYGGYLAFRTYSAGGIHLYKQSAGGTAAYLYDNGGWFDHRVISPNGFRIRANLEDMVIGNTNGSIELYHDNVKVFETEATGWLTTLAGGSGTLRLTNTGDGALFYSSYAGAPIVFQARDVGDSTDHTLVSMDPDTGIVWYHNNAIVVGTMSGGLFISGSDDTAGLNITISSPNVTIKNRVDGGDIYLKGEVAVDSEVSFADFEAGGAFTFYHNNQPVLKSTTSGASVTSPVTGATWFDVIDPDDSGQLTRLIHTGDGSSINVYTSGASTANFSITVDNGSSQNTVAVANYLGLSFYYNTAVAAEIMEYGIKVKGSSGESWLKHNHANNAFELTPYNANAGFTLFVTNGSYIAETAIKGNANGSVDLYYDNLLAAKTAAEGFAVYDTSGDDPTLWFIQDDGSTANGYIEFNTTGFEIVDSILSDTLISSVSGIFSIYYLGTKTVDVTSESINIYSTDWPGVSSRAWGYMSHDGTGMRIDNSYTNGTVTLSSRGGTIMTGGTATGVALYYATGNRFSTVSAGIQIKGSAGNVYTISPTATETVLLSATVASHILLRGGATSGGYNTMIDADPDAAVSLYYDGTKCLDTISTGDGGIRIYEPTTGKGTDLYNDGTGDFYVIARTHGASLFLQAENASGTVNSLFGGDPDAAVSLYYAGAKCLDTIATGDGGIRIYEPTTGEGTDLYNDGTGDFYMIARTHSASLFLQAENSSGTVKSLFSGDPDGGASLYHAGVERLKTLGDGIQLVGSLDIAGGSGSPEGVRTAAVGSLWLRSDGGASTTLYVKESGTGNTGWVAK
jgi:hypothetical protein